MAIAFARAAFENFRRTRTSGHLIGYLGRDCFATLLGGKIDFSDLGGDVVHQEARLPADCPPIFHDEPAALGALFDAAELSHVKKWEGRARHPQFGLHVVFALPPDGELSLDDGIELNHRLVAKICRSNDLAAYSAIHDPRLLQGKAFLRNRHGHNLIFLRTVHEGRVNPKKVRNLVGRVRMKGSSGNGSFVEGISWPNLAWALQVELIDELGLDLIVDPPALAPDHHFSPLVWAYDRDRVASMKADRVKQNRSIVDGEPANLVSRLLRGRMTMRVSELRRVVAKWVPQGDLDRCWARIVTHSDLRTVAPRDEKRPMYVTTAELDAQSRDVQSIVSKAARDPLDGAHWMSSHLSGVRGVNEEDVIAALRAAIGDDLSEAVEPIGEILLVHTQMSAIETLWVDDLPRRSRRLTCKDALDKVRWSSGTVVVAPYSERIDDVNLTRMILKATAANASLVLGFNESDSHGTTLNRLAAYVASRLTKKCHGRAANEPSTVSAERLLRAGQIREAVDRLFLCGRLAFGWTGDERLSGDRVVVTDDHRRLQIGAHICEDRGEVPADAYGVPLWGGYVPVRAGDRVVFTRTDYRILPPVVREGEQAEILEFTRPGVAVLSVEAGSVVTLDLRTWPHVRPAHTLTIAEARRARRRSMDIEVTRASKAWAALILAGRAADARVIVDIFVAADCEQLASTIEQRLPVVFIPDLAERIDPDAEADNILDALMGSILGPEEKTAPALSTRGFDQTVDVRLPMQRLPIDNTLLERIRDNRYASRGFLALYAAIGPGAHSRDKTLARVEAGVDPGSLMAALVDIIKSENRFPPNVGEFDALEGSIGAISLGSGHTEQEVQKLLDQLESMSSPWSNWKLVQEGDSADSKSSEPSPRAR